MVKGRFPTPQRASRILPRQNPLSGDDEEENEDEREDDEDDDTIPTTGTTSGTTGTTGGTTGQTTQINPLTGNTTGGITMAEVAKHNSAASCYTAISGSVYDLTAWVNQHPGGKEAILSLCGTDGTAAFKNQHGGQKKQEDTLATYKIGLLSQ